MASHALKLQPHSQVEAREIDIFAEFLIFDLEHDIRIQVKIGAYWCRQCHAEQEKP